MLMCISYNHNLLKAVLVKTVFFSTAVYMCEWERNKSQPTQSAEKTEEGAAEAAAPTAAESQEGQSASEGESSSQWPPASAGVTYELCAGLVDKPDLSLEEIARQEVLEECGYDVPASKLKRITSYRLVCAEPILTHTCGRGLNVLYNHRPVHSQHRV